MFLIHDIGDTTRNLTCLGKVVELGCMFDQNIERLHKKCSLKYISLGGIRAFCVGE